MKIPNINEIKISKNQLLVLLVGTLIVVFVLIIILQSLWGGVKQPIVFNHKIHAENDLD